MPGFFVLLEATSPRLSRSANDYFQSPTGRVVEGGTQVTIQGVSPSMPIIGEVRREAHHGLKPVVAPCPKSADERYEIAWNQQISSGCLLR